MEMATHRIRRKCGSRNWPHTIGLRRRSQTRGFLIIPAEEANVHLGGHWALVFPKPVLWFMKRPADKPFESKDPAYGTVYHVGNEQEMLDLMQREGGYAYQSHPRTKGSTGFPDKIKETAHFRDSRYWGAGWKAMPSDLSSLRQGLRALNLLDDMNNWGLPKRLIGEVDVFQIDATHELYAHMNVNYVRLDRLPDFDHYGQVLEALNRGDYFVSTGEVLLPKQRSNKGLEIKLSFGRKWLGRFHCSLPRLFGAMG